MTVTKGQCNGNVNGENSSKYKYARVDLIETGCAKHESSLVSEEGLLESSKQVSQRKEENRRQINADSASEELLTCGWCGWSPRCLQRFNVAPWLLAVMCSVVLFQGMITSGLIGSSATSIERRFQLRSKDYGLLVSIYEATHISVILFVTFIGGRGHKPRWISIGCLIVGLGSLLFALPHFTTDTYNNFYDGDGDPGVCELNDEDAVEDARCVGGEGAFQYYNYIYIFGAAQVLLSLGSLPVYTLGIAVLDESVTLRQSGVYLGIYYALSNVGPALGYVVAGVSLNTFTEITIPEGVVLTPDDPGWIGAWWIGFVLAGIAMLIISLPLGAFPRELPTTAKIRSEKECQAHVNSGVEITTHPGFGSKPSDLFRALKYLLINPTFMCTTLAGCADSLLITAFGVFLPKFIENQFSTTATIATTIVGMTIVPGGAGGVLLGGWLLRRLRLRVTGMLRFCVLMTVVTALVIPTLFLRCAQNTLAGVTASYEQLPNHITENSTYAILSSIPNLTHTCNLDCRCSTTQYTPVCLNDLKLEFFSPCHAGCMDQLENGTYADCSCVEHATGGERSMVQPGRCGMDCSMLPVFVSLLVLLLIVLFVPMVPALNVTLRTVPESQRSMALGLQSVVVRCLGSIPGPILVGAIIDSTCLQWQETCTGYGSCWLYHKGSLAWRLVLLGCGIKVFSGFMFVWAWCAYKPAASPHRTEFDAHDATGSG